MLIEGRLSIEEATRRQKQALAQALGDVSETCLQDSNETIPIETGAMARSGFAELDEDQPASQVAYDTEYVVRQHEDTELRHDPGRRAKWLERTVEENKRDYERHIADTVRRATP